MDISNLNTVNQQVPSVVKLDEGTTLQKSAARGNVLPTLEKAVQSSSDEQQSESPKFPPTEEALRDLVAKANETSQARSSDLKFSVAEGGDTSVVRIEDSETGELIRQIPSEAMVELARALDEQRQGMMLEEKV